MSSILSVFGLRSLPFSSAKSFSPTIQGEHCDLIALLATLQQTSVPILPLMWHPALLPVGEGGFGAVTQAIQDVRTKFAFKRVREKKTSDRDGETTERAFRAIIAEVSVLGDERLQRHPYLAKLEGVCWEVENKTVWPVLVAEKAEHGDLRNFIIGQRGKQMPRSERYEMCFGIGNGVQALHAAGRFRPSFPFRVCVPR
jgi:serine/threonine protein kinase